MALLANELASFPSAEASILAVALMGTGMIGAAAAGRFWAGTLFGLVSGLSLILFANWLGLAANSHQLWAGLVVLIASVSFAARGKLFALSGRGKGWLIAVLVLAGEAAVVLTAVIDPELWPNWLLALLPAQWASMAFQTSIVGTGVLAATPVLIALGGTAVATLLVVRLWPRRWPYLIMFTTWLGLAALVFHHTDLAARVAQIAAPSPDLHTL